MMPIQCCSDAYARACASFQEAAQSSDPIPSFVAGMRAICTGVEFGALSVPQRAVLSSCVAGAKMGMIRALAGLMPGADIGANPYQSVPQLMQTSSLAIMWGTPEAERAGFGMASIEDQCAQLRISANLFESVARSGWIPPIHAPSSECRH